MSKLLKAAAIIIAAALLPFMTIAAQIYFYHESSPPSADAAIVLGAAVWSDKPSPVFRERINHALNLYRQKKIKKIIFTGGQGNTDEQTEAEIGALYAINESVSRADILLENKSRTTYENLLFARDMLRENQIDSVLVVTDPLHLKRSMAMAETLAINAYPAPTPTTVYQGFAAQADFLLRETFYYFVWQLRDFVRPM